MSSCPISRLICRGKRGVRAAEARICCDPGRLIWQMGHTRQWLGDQGARGDRSWKAAPTRQSQAEIKKVAWAKGGGLGWVRWGDEPRRLFQPIFPFIFFIFFPCVLFYFIFKFQIHFNFTHKMQQFIITQHEMQVIFTYFINYFFPFFKPIASNMSHTIYYLF
jgi:hypothetical protein